MANEKIIKQVISSGLGTLNVYKANNGFIIQDPRVGGIFTLNGEGDLFQVATQVAEELTNEIIAALKGNTVASIYVVVKEKPLLVFDEKNPSNTFFGPLGFGGSFGSKFSGDQGAEYVMKAIRPNDDDNKQVVRAHNVYGPQETGQFIIIPAGVQDAINTARKHTDGLNNVNEESLGDGKFRVKGK